MKRYSLQSYKGIATRHTCPSCGDKRSFVYYVDEENTPLHPSVGRCNYESSCGYHYTPKQYFQDHPECRTFDASSFDGQMKEVKSKSTPTEPMKPTPIGYVPIHYVEKSKSVQSNFFRFLSILLGNYYGSKSQEVLNRLLDEYRLGATRDGAVIFWQIDKNGKVRTGKVMQYNPEDGHRIKEQGVAINWIHNILKKQNVLPEEWLLSQCLFGEHLLSLYPDKVVVLVESEKSAIIGSAIFPNYVWLATGGKSQMKEDKLRVLSGRTVLLFPDADGYTEWKQTLNASALPTRCLKRRLPFMKPASRPTSGARGKTTCAPCRTRTFSRLAQSRTESCWRMCFYGRQRTSAILSILLFSRLCAATGLAARFSVSC